MHQEAVPQRREMADKTVEELLLFIGDAGKGYKKEAIKMLHEWGMNGCLDQLEQAVRNDGNADLRNGAMEMLVIFGSAAIPVLVRLLDDGNEEVRNFSTVMLGDIGCNDAVGPLIRALRDQDDNVRHGAAEALGKIGDLRAVQPLQQLLDGDYWDKLYADAALALLGGE